MLSAGRIWSWCTGGKQHPNERPACLYAHHARAYPVDVNITLSIDEALADRARADAAGRGKSLNQLVRDLLEAETGTRMTGQRAHASWTSSG